MRPNVRFGSWRCERVSFYTWGNTVDVRHQQRLILGCLLLSVSGMPKHSDTGSFADCCALANAQVAAAPPVSLMNSRRLIDAP